MQKTCRDCQAPFGISDAEVALHAKITESFGFGKVPAPSLCLDCRFQRMMAWRNERHLHHRICDKSKKNILSVYPAGTPFPVYERSEWWSDSWDALSYGIDFDLSKSFFDQFKRLMDTVPRQALNLQNSENCDYCNFAFESRNCYLTRCSYRSESLLYCYWLLDCKDCIDCSYCFETQLSAHCTDCNRSYRCINCTLAHSCSECERCYDCRNCQNCFGCVGLRRKQYCFLNEQLTKDEYEQRLSDWREGKMDPVEIQQKIGGLREKHPHLFSIQEKTEGCTGDYVFESKDCTNCFQIYRSQDCINVQDAETKDALDCYHPGWSELTYQAYSPVNQTSSAFSAQCWIGDHVFYSDNCQSCSNCFGCVSLRQKKYCILNKQYSKEDYEVLVKKIVDHMRKTGEWGEFFPLTLSPFAYNETLAHEEYPLTEAETKNLGLRWAEQKDAIPTVEKIIPGEKLPERIENIPDDILNWAIECERTKRPFRIIKQELDLYRTLRIPVPRLHPDERWKERIKTRNPRKLFTRTCKKCKKAIETTYAPDRPEKIYCEECYLKAVY